jgi:uncharacterized membrane protein YgcG
VSTQRTITIFIVAFVGIFFLLFVLGLAFFAIRASRRKNESTHPSSSNDGGIPFIPMDTSSDDSPQHHGSSHSSHHDSAHGSSDSGSSASDSGGSDGGGGNSGD